MTRQRPDLTAGLDAEQRRRLGDLTRVEEGMAGYLAPEPSPGSTDALLAKLLPLMAGEPRVAEPTAQTDAAFWSAPADGAPLPTETLPDWAPPTGLRYWRQLALSQRPLMEPMLLWALGLLVALAAMAATVASETMIATTLLCVSPALAAAGVSYLFRPATRTLRELEKAAPIRALEILYLRLSLLLAGNLIVLVGLATIAALHEPNLVLWRMVLTWLGPMIGLTGGALYCSVRWGAIAGVAAPIVAWAGYLALGWQWTMEQSDRVEQLGSWALVTISNADSVLLLSGVVALAGVILLRVGSRMAMQDGAAWS